MKDNKTKLSLLVATLLTMGYAAQAKFNKGEIAQDGFAPIESLAPEDRTTLMPQIEMLRKDSHIDWNSVSVGINAKGEIVLMERDAADEGPANPTSWATE